MEKYIILITNHESRFDTNIYSIEDIAHCTIDGDLMMFDSLDEAADYRDEHTINGLLIELPIY